MFDIIDDDDDVVDVWYN